MNDDIELVDLPDPAVQPLVHPVDVGDARGWFARASLIDALTNPAMTICIAVIIWFASASLLVAALAGFTTLWLGARARRHALREAWAHIPRRRQDTGRRPPVMWDVASAVLLSIVLAAAVLLAVNRIAESGVPVDVRAFIAGAATVTAAAVVLDWLVSIRRTDTRGARHLATAPLVIAVVAVTIISARVLLTDVAWSQAATGWGASMMLAAVLVALTSRRGWIDR